MSFKNVFETTDPYQLEYIRDFRKQLKLQETNGLQWLMLPAILILINTDLNPHCNSMNQSWVSEDYILSLSIQFPTQECPVEFRESIQETYPFFVPMCIVIYKRKALINYAQRMNSFENS